MIPGSPGVSQESKLDSGVVSGHGRYWNPGGSLEVWKPPEYWKLLWEMRVPGAVRSLENCEMIFLEPQGPGALGFKSRGVSAALEFSGSPYFCGNFLGKVFRPWR